MKEFILKMLLLVIMRFMLSSEVCASAVTSVVFICSDLFY